MVSDPLFTMVQRALAGTYSLEREIGRGGMGVVFLAREVELGRLVALKVLPPAVAAEPGTRERFLREARTAAGLSHPHIVPIYRVGEAGDIVYFSMMFVDGGTLGERLRTRGPLSPASAIRMLREVSQALAYAHGRGIVHRDIKPDNILLERESGRALVTDFGIAGDAGTERDDRVRGTEHFMSPEQAAGRRVDGRSDLYSLAVVAHLALAGRLPMRAAGVIRAGDDAIPGQALALASPAMPQHLVAAIERGLAVDPEGRFASAEAFATAVDVTTASRRAVPAPIRTWLTARDPWLVVYLLWSAGWLISAVYGMTGEDEAYGLFKFVMSTVPAIPAMLFELRTTHRLVAAGYSLDDVDAAVPAWETEESEESLAGEPSRPGWFAPVARAIAWGTMALPFLLDAAEKIYYYGDAVFLIALVGAAAALPLLSALGVPVLPAFAMADKPLRRHFWDSALGRRIERLLQRGRHTLAPANAFRPTELVVGSAVDALWKSLPAAYRERLEDVPAVVKRLEAHASRARAVLVQVEEASIAVPASDLAPARDRARRELESAVTALESLRLDLLRLLGGDTDLAPTTTVLDAARRVDDDLTRLRNAQREVERVVKPIELDLRPHTPV